MTRYTINIGDDFPLGGDDGPGRGDSGDHHQRRGRRYGLFLRVLFFLAVAAIVIGHPLHTLLVVGVVLFIRRSPAFAAWRERARTTWRDPAWRRERISAWQRQGCSWARHDRSRKDQQNGESGYRGFV